MQFEQSDIDILAAPIAAAVLEKLRPLISGHAKKDIEPDVIFDVKGLCEYLKVSQKWVYERTCRNEIPFFKIGKHLRFKKKNIDKWLDSLETPAVNRFQGQIPVRVNR